MTYRNIGPADLKSVAAFYMDYYNRYEDGCWTAETALRRIRPICTREDACCIFGEDDGRIVCVVFGWFTQYDDLLAYDLDEIVVAKDAQGRGVGTRLMQEMERRIKAAGGAMIQLTAVNDEMHEHFYKKLGFYTPNNLILKAKQL